MHGIVKLQQRVTYGQLPAFSRYYGSVMKKLGMSNEEFQSRARQENKLVTTASGENRAITNNNNNSTSKPAIEVKIPVPWGHISGKWWGATDAVPVLCLHGFEDNAGSFANLAPLLEVPAVLAWDAPGHGQSSHFPPGKAYNFMDFVISVRFIVKHYGWETFSVIGHSFGSVTALIYSSLYPNDIDRYVSVDCARTLMPNIGILGLRRMRSIASEVLKADADANKSPPAYSKEEMIDLTFKGTFESVLKSNIQPLLERGILPHPTKDNSYYFSRDRKLRFGDFCRPTNEMVDACSERVKCHMMAILAKQGFVHIVGEEVQKRYEMQEQSLIKSTKSYKRHDVAGTHHVHLNNPERVAPLVNQFLSQGY